MAATPLFRTPVYGQNQAPSANVAGANNRIQVAIVGVGFGIGQNHLKGIQEKATENNTVITAASDVFNKRRDFAKAKANLKDADVYDDYRKMLERKDIDAVLWPRMTRGTRRLRWIRWTRAGTSIARSR